MSNSVSIGTIKNVFDNRKAVQEFLAMDEGSNAYIKQESALRAVGIKLSRQKLAELESVFGNQGAVQRFLDLRNDSIQSEGQAAVLHELGINPDKQFLTNVMTALRTKPDIVDKAERYVTLNKLEGSGAKLSSEAANEIASLRRELAARGLNPQSQQELVQRAIIYDNAPSVCKYCELVECVKHHAGKCTRATRKRLGKLKYELKKAGIQNMDCRYLSHCLASFKTEAKIADKRKRAPRRNVSPARELAYQMQAQIAAEIADEEAQAAAAELAAEKKARAKRDRLVRESINTFMAEALNMQFA